MPAAPQDLSKMIPGFDFLQRLAQGAGGTLPKLGNWVAPTLDPDELGKRIEELKTVQFWLEQNARMIATTVQALEVQRMTLSTLKSMNVQMGDLAEAFSIRPATDAAPAPSPAKAQATAQTADEAGTAPTKRAGASARAKAGAKAAAAAAPGVVDPTQWWAALTKQFSQLAAAAMRESGGTAGAAPAAAPKAAAKTSAAAARRRR